MPLKDNWVTGESFPATAQNDVAIQVNRLAAKTFDVEDYGADPTGATGDLGAIITSLAAALHASGGGTITVPPGTYRFTTTGTINTSTVNLVGAGAGAVTFVPQSSLGTSPCIDISARTGWSVDHGGKYSGFTIDGAATPSGIGLLYGDVVRGCLDDIFIDNYSQGDALQFCNRVHWTERTVLTRVTLGDNNRRGWSFKIDGGGESFGYLRGEVALNLQPVTAAASVASVTTTAGSTSATVASGGFPSVTTGMSVDGTNLYGGTEVSSVSGNTLTLSIPAKASGTATVTAAAGNQTGIYVGTGCYCYHSALTLIANVSGGTAGTNQSPVLLKVNTGFFAGSSLGGMEGMTFTVHGEADSGKVTPVWVGANTIFDGFGDESLFFSNASSYRSSTSVVRLSGRAAWGFAPNDNPAMNYAITDNLLHMFRGRRQDETHDRLTIFHDGSIWFGSGTGTPDIKLYRHPAGWLSTLTTFLGENGFLSIPGSSTSDAFGATASGDAVFRLIVDAAGKHKWSDGTAAVDTTLERTGAGTLGLNGSNPVVSKVAVPSTATSTGKVGQIAADSSFLYICTAANTWRRVAIASW